MKKIAIFVIIILVVIISIFGIIIYSTSKPSNVASTFEATLEAKILDNSKWVEISKEDLNGYLNGTYTKTVTSIINSLEDATPIIFQTSSNRFSNIDDGIFIVASAFTTDNKVYVYYYSPESSNYKKTTATLESLLEDCTAAYIYNETEGLQWKKYIT